MTPVRITVTSSLPEFRGMGRIERIPIEPDQTWSTFFRILPPNLSVPFQDDLHGIKTSKNRALPDDEIRETSSKFSRDFINVQIIAIPQNSRTNRPNRRGGRPRARAPLLRSAAQISVAGLLPNIGRSRVTTTTPTPRVHPTPSAHASAPVPGPSSRAHASAGPSTSNTIPVLTRPIRIFDDDNLSTNATSGSQATNLDNLDAASMASDDSQDTEIVGGGNQGFSALKMRVIKQIARIPNQDFEQMREELRGILSDTYKWSRKTPRVGNMILDAFRP